MTNTVNPLSIIAAAPSTGSSGSSGNSSNWFEAMAEAWGKALDAKATEIETTSAKLTAGDDRPATITKLSAQSLEMSFLSNSSHTSMSSVGTALETLARKQ
jgi:hypothetical protein